MSAVFRESPLTKKQIDSYVAAAAKVAGYEEGFGVNGCDLE